MRGQNREQKRDIDSRVNVSGDDKLFQDPPPKEDCLICMLPMPFANGVCGVKKVYQPCCGKMICTGCMVAATDEMNKGTMKRLCPFCRFPITYTPKNEVKKLKKRMNMGDAEAFRTLGGAYQDGGFGLPKDLNKSTELFIKAADLGSIDGRYDIAAAYWNGEGIEVDKDKAIHYFKLAAIGGHENARHNLGMMAANKRLAMKHHMMAARSGHDESLKAVGQGYKDGHVTKDDYANALRAHKESNDEMKSEERSRAVDCLRVLQK